MDETHGERDVERELRSRVAVDEEPALDPDWPPPTRRRLVRRAHDKWVAGVAGGLADHWAVPAQVVRIPLAIAAGVCAWTSWEFVTNGAIASHDVFRLIVMCSFVATIAYFVLWVVVPREDETRSPVGKVGEGLSPRRLTARHPNLGSIPAFAALAIGGAILAERLGIWEPDLALAAALIALGVWLYRRDRDARSDVRLVEPPDERDASATGAAVAVPAQRYEPVPRVPRERSPLGWITFGVALLVVCMAAIWSGLASDLGMPIAAIPALGLIVLSLGLLIGSMFGRARWLILPALALVPVLLVTSVIRLPFEGPIGDSFLRVGEGSAGSSNEAVVRRRAFGSIYVDLNRLRGATDVTRELQLSTVAGAVTVVVPFDAHVEVTAFTGLGTIDLDRRSAYGVELTETATLEPRRGDGATVIVSAEVGLGNVYVLRNAPTKRQLRALERQERHEQRGNGAGS